MTLVYYIHGSKMKEALIWHLYIVFMVAKWKRNKFVNWLMYVSALHVFCYLQFELKIGLRFVAMEFCGIEVVFFFVSLLHKFWVGNLCNLCGVTNPCKNASVFYIAYLLCSCCGWMIANLLMQLSKTSSLQNVFAIIFWSVYFSFQTLRPAWYRSWFVLT